MGYIYVCSGQQPFYRITFITSTACNPRGVIVRRAQVIILCKGIILLTTVYAQKILTLIEVRTGKMNQTVFGN